MTSAPSQSGIINSALALLGAARSIASINDGSNAANAAKACWDEVVRTMLADFAWNFAKRRAALNASADAPAFGYERQFALPVDCLRWLPPDQDESEAGPSDLDPYFEARQEGNLLLTDAEAPLPVRYISAAAGDAIALWPSYFVTAMVAEMAFRLAEPVTQSESIKKDAMQRAMMELRRAKRKDSMASGINRRTRVSARSDWLRARETPYYRYGGR